MLLFSKSLRIAATALIIMLSCAQGFAQAPTQEAIKRSDQIAPEMKALSAQGDHEGARRIAEEASARFKAEGEAWLSASYMVSAADYAMRMGDAARVDGEYYPRMRELLATLDPVEETRANLLIELLMDAKGRLSDRAGQDELVAFYEKRIRKAHGENSEQDIDARVRAAYSLLESGRLDDGRKHLRAALAASAKTKLHAVTLKHYAQAARSFHASGLNEDAAALFREAEGTAAIQAEVKELADFYLAYAEFRTAVPDSQQHFVPLYSMATNLYARFYGTESEELIHANDKLASALSGVGQYGTAIDLEKRNYEIAEKSLGSDNTITWRIANNLADMLRGLGSPSRALEYDLKVLENRTRHYGQNHFNTLVSANNTAQNYLDLGDYATARHYFSLCLDISNALGDAGNIAGMEAWIAYTDLLSGAAPMDDAAVSRMEALVTDSNYPGILSIKAAYLLADHFARKGDHARQIKHLQQAYSIAAGEMSTGHPLAFAGRIAIANAKAETDPETAAQEFAGIDQDMLRWVHLQVSVAGGRDVGETVRAMADDMLYHYARFAERNPSAVPAFADAARRWPSLATPDADNVLKLTRMIDTWDTETARLLDRISRLSRIAREIFAADVEQDLAYAYLTDTKAMERELHQRLVKRYHVDRQAILNQSLPTPAELVGKDQAFVQYFTTRKWRADHDAADPIEDTQLYAIVWRSGKAPVMRALGDPRAVLGNDSDAVAALESRSGGDENRGLLVEAHQRAFARLHERLIGPVEKELAGAKTLFIVPDGRLFALPFSLLEAADGTLLEERFTLRLLTEPEALYRAVADARMPKDGRAVLAGGIDYEKGDEAGATPLPGTLREVEAIRGILDGPGMKVETLTGAAASETALRERMTGAKIAHLATHGAYGSPKNGGTSNVDTLWQSEVILAHSGDTRTMRRDEKDGRLYAFELMAWDLSGLDLLVLSACETALGDEAFVGGVRGLPTAASLAGAKRALLTLWPVADDGTADFMVRYYGYLKDGQTYAEALRNTRHDAIAGKIPTAKDPLVWAAFVLFEN
ncbi:CHAT domain-containing tetratricopeptide repeat protein [Shinella oryzae]|uniref:CHAT domain-containing tetratricopeptide repeat protein n=1 Tax=Shinella oryzae TaxID=2871820 RepID=UPI001FF1F50C|nr:CHAT domain-containing tetratricopeptide repeat protein [Shinella oryzae]UPA26634.1 CHAT domain-containing protein [Shinella oryzae]